MIKLTLFLSLFISFGFAQQPLAVATYGNDWGVIDSTGKWLLNPEYTNIREVTEGRIVVKTSGGWGVKDLNGNWVLEPSLDRIYSYSDSMAIFKAKVVLWFHSTTTENG